MSVVFMPTPRYETWAMESALQPYVHYIPIEHDLSNLEARVAWARSNVQMCKHFASGNVCHILNYLNYESQNSDISNKA